MKKKFFVIMLVISLLCSSTAAFASEPQEELVGASGFIGETNIENEPVRELVDTNGKAVTTAGEEGKIKVIITGRVTLCGLTIGAVNYLGGRLGDNARVEIITRDCDGNTSQELAQMVAQGLSGSLAGMAANYGKVHITGDYYANKDMWSVVDTLNIDPGSLPLVIVVDPENKIRYCSMSKSNASLAPLADYVERLVKAMEETVPDKPEPDKPASFSDVEYNPGNWRYDSVEYVYDKGIMNGISGTDRFEPDGYLTRGMFATVLYRMAGEPPVQFENKFQDVEAGRYYSNAVIWAYSKGIVQGVDGGARYGTEEFITREQIAKMLMEYAKDCGYYTGESADLDNFPDASDVSGWASGYMKWAVGCGMIGGKNVGGVYYLDPKGNATRVECAAMLTRFMKKYQ